MPWIASVSAHALVVALALLISAPDSQPGPQAFVTIDLFSPAPASASSAIAPAQRSLQEESQARSPSPEVVAAGSSLPSFAAIVKSPTRRDSLESEAEAAPSQAPGSDAEAAATALSLDAVSTEGAALAGMGASEARRIVYVLDASGSMVTTWPDAALAVAQSIRALHPTQRFAIIAHPQSDADRWPGGASYAAPRIPATASRPTLLDATPGNIERSLAWLAARAPSGRSMSLDALTFAASLEPDAIFLVSSGDWDAAGQERASPSVVVEQLGRALGARPPTIKVIAVEREDATGALRAIARAFGGEEGYRLLTAEELAERAGRAAPESPSTQPANHP